jgi:threonine/homoserine/homoserine lactone efflux protein
MPKLFQVLFWGFLISFLGSLPLGTLNVAAMQIGIQESVINAMYFSFGSLLIEMLYVRISLVGIDWVRKQARVMRFMEWITLGIIIALAVGSFVSAIKDDGSTKSILLNNNMNRFLLGMMMCAINPVQIPFWFGWSTVLFSRGLLEANSAQYNVYIIGIGMGTLLGNSIFIFGGQLVASAIRDNQSLVSLVIGSIFLVTAFWQLYKFLRNKGAVHRITHSDEETSRIGEQLDRWRKDSSE